MDIISGTPALRAHAMRGLVQSHGHSIILAEATETRCKMKGRRKGEEEWQTVTWTKERADRLGLWGKSEWKKQPQTMLMARATGELRQARPCLRRPPRHAVRSGGTGRRPAGVHRRS